MLNQKYVIGTILTILIVFLIYYFFKDSVVEDVKKEDIKISQINNTKKIEVVPDKTENIVSNMENKEEKAKEKQIEEKGKVLFSSVDSTGRYTILLINDVDIEIPKKNSTRYIPVLGEIEENSNISTFTISISEDYINFLSDLKIKIIDKLNEKRVIETHSYFLGNLDLDSLYNISLYISGDTLDGKIKSSSKIPDFILKSFSNNNQPIVINEDDYKDKPSNNQE